MFVKTDTILDQILARKSQDLLAVRSLLPGMMAAADEAPPARNFAGSLQRDTVGLIAEVKKASPSKGVLIDPFDPQELAHIYAENGAAAISILTDTPFFQGHLDHLRVAKQAVNIPVLRKDFTIAPYQVYEGRAVGADAMLLIVMALEDAQLKDLHALILELGMAALVEVHNEAEMERALAIGASLIGVNNRDLRTFQEDLTITVRVAAIAPPNITLVAESAIRSVDDVRRMGEIGAHAILVGEGLVKSANIGEQVRRFSSQPRGVRDGAR
jgi:indole-3-glycerol phosphate synthase